MTIARMWHGKTLTSRADAYLDYLNRTGLPEYQKIPGNLGVTVLRRDEGEVTHFVLISFWKSYDAIRTFAGDILDDAMYYPEDVDYLIDLEPKVIHYEVVW